MGNIVYYHNKKNGVTYAYESIPYWDKEKKQGRSKRKCIGHVDPMTGEIVPNQKRSRNSALDNPSAPRHPSPMTAFLLSLHPTNPLQFFHEC